ncbi:MAG: LysM peptidoglycan-binding domain-containing protein [Gemmatimonadetes bacterium]|nr:LysM peptidoglycan-binding domain-containing protein [Gemmatimonadota bacterium]
MRRTTICRSSASFLTAALLAGLVAGTAASQQPTQPQAQQQPPAAPALAPPATHVVQPGETLWSLAQQFFGDPLLWPEIYRLNTTVIEDPHWIYPGEELSLVPTEEPAAPGVPVVPQNVTVSPTGDTVQPTLPPARAMEAPTIFSPTLSAGTGPRPDAIEIENRLAYRAVREGEYYSAGFLTEGRALAGGRLLGNVQTSSIRRLTSSTTAMLFADVAVEPPPGETFERGDLLLVYRIARQIRGYGDVVRPTGLLRVAAPAGEGGNIAATVVAVYGQITDGQSVLKVAPFSFRSSARAAEVADGVTGEVVALRDIREIVGLQDVLFINRGAEDGVRLGDIFALSGAARAGVGVVEQDLGKALIVNTRERTSTAVIVEITRPDIESGAAARQIRRMPS